MQREPGSRSDCDDGRNRIAESAREALTERSFLDRRIVIRLGLEATRADTILRGNKILGRGGGRARRVGTGRSRRWAVATGRRRGGLQLGAAKITNRFARLSLALTFGTDNRWRGLIAVRHDHRCATAGTTPRYQRGAIRFTELFSVGIG